MLFRSEKIYYFDTSQLQDGEYHVEINANDLAQNSISSKIYFQIDHSIIDPPKSSIISSQTQSETDFLPLVLGIMAVIPIVSGIVVFKQKSKIPQKN